MHQCGRSDFTSQRMPAACLVRTTAHSLTHTHSLTPLPTHTLTHSLLHPLTTSFTHSLPPSPTHTLTHPLLHPLTHTHSLTLTHSLTHSHSLTHLLPPAETLLNFYQLCYRNGSVAEMLGKTSLWDDEATGAEPVTHSGRNTCITLPYMAHGGDLG